jgi:hypothetical protein
MVGEFKIKKSRREKGGKEETPHLDVFSVPLPYV